MSTLEITILVAADPSENVHSRIKADCVEIWEIGPMLDRAIADLTAEREALPPSHQPRTTGGPDGR